MVPTGRDLDALGADLVLFEELLGIHFGLIAVVAFQRNYERRFVVLYLSVHGLLVRLHARGEEGSQTQEYDRHLTTTTRGFVRSFTAEYPERGKANGEPEPDLVISRIEVGPHFLGNELLITTVDLGNGEMVGDDRGYSAVLPHMQERTT